jgi:proline iminopeptidase
LVVVAGGPGVHHNYLRAGGAFDAIAQSQPVVFYDQRGTGDSATADEANDIHTFVADLECVVDALGVPTVDMLGHSFGGYLAMAFVSAHTRRVRRLVLAASMAPRASDTTSLFDLAYPDIAPRWAAARAQLPDLACEDDFALYNAMALPNEALRQTYAAATAGKPTNVRLNNQLRKHMQQLDFAREFFATAPPTMILHGRRDVVIAPKVAWSLHGELANSSLEWFEDCGHLLFLEAPMRFAAVVTQFLSR